MLPLSGLKVLDFTTLLPGPLATLMLAEAGAEVTRIERPGGEDMRRFPPLVNGTSAAYAVLNAGKSVLELDLKSPQTMDVLRPLIAEADILVEQFRPGVMDRLGLGREAVKAINPRIIYCSISGYGATGPRAAEAGHDLNYVARSGLLSLSPGTLEAPTLPAALVADIAGGTMPAVINILLALRRRDMTGEGAYLDIGMADGLFTFAWYGLAQGHATGRFPGAGENDLAGALPRYALYATADARFLAVGALEEKFWQAFCDAVELPEHLRDDRRTPDETRAAVAARIRMRSAAEWEAVMAPLDCCATVVSSLEEALADEHFVARGVQAARILMPDGSTMPAAAVPIVPELRVSSDAVRVVPGPKRPIPAA